MELQDKSINFLGDSITEGAAASTADRRYVDRIQKLCGLRAARNYGVSGTRIAKNHVPGNPSYGEDFLTRFQRMDKQADALVIFGGTNDFGHGDAPLGRPGDETPETFCGALAALLSAAKETFGARVLVVTPLPRRDQDNAYGDGSKEVPGAVLGDYVSAMREIVGRVGQFALLDLFADPDFAFTDGVNPFISEDGLHPNDEGHRLLAEKISAALKEL